MPTILDIKTFIQSSIYKNCIDVRSPLEYNQGHIPFAINMPLFTNEERAIVGTIYKQQGKQPAITKGLEFVGPKLVQFVEFAQKSSFNNVVFIYCWRGGMRSGSVAWLLEMYGLKVFILKGGYKAFRNYTLEIFKSEKKIKIIGGKTGSGKTLILEQLAQKNQQIINLEKIANHKGSAFGALGELQQPSQEQFENNLAIKLLETDNINPIWIEDESRLIGNKVIPEELWQKMLSAPVIFIDIPFNERVSYLVEQYGKYSKNDLHNAIIKIAKRLGGEQTKLCIEALEINDLTTVCKICLLYYDKSYQHGLLKREVTKVKELHFTSLNIEKITHKLIEQN
ncbi:MAG: tRNA 2-selenouridine(34) synthase MnmH [Bacteroidota bacterium]|nr:tRNA 2-selenouridine(34) synthase MnmH [Bacteroidota bacterium]